MSKNIVICCDGTCNKVEEDLSNVLKLYRVLFKHEKQIVYYDPGMGTFGNKLAWSQKKQALRYGFYSLTGANFDDNLLKAYRFLVETYEPGDQVFLFGYSRGAYLVRALAGMIHLVGLLSRQQINLTEYALGAYKEAASRKDFKIAWRLQRVLSTKPIPIKFVGVWDSVSYVLVPGWGGIKQQTLPYTATNPCVENFYQACAIDERRAMFRLNRWNMTDQIYKPNPFSREVAAPQNAQQVWFCGCHGDVGGGYKEDESGLAKYPLSWLISKAKTHGLRINTGLYNHLVLGVTQTNSPISYSKPDPTAPIHNSLSLRYWLLELIPRKQQYKEWGKRKSFLGFYLPLAEPRKIQDGEKIHYSVIERMERDPSYNPCNLPSKYAIEN